MPGSGHGARLQLATNLRWPVNVKTMRRNLRTCEETFVAQPSKMSAAGNTGTAMFFTANARRGTASCKRSSLACGCDTMTREINLRSRTPQRYLLVATPIQRHGCSESWCTCRRSTGEERQTKEYSTPANIFGQDRPERALRSRREPPEGPGTAPLVQACTCFSVQPPVENVVLRVVLSRHRYCQRAMTRWWSPRINETQTREKRRQDAGRSIGHREQSARGP